MLRALRQGHIPRHVAFIMDGNRRYARKHQREALFGHALGFESMKRALEWCLELGVECLTCYAFSLDNFRRPPAEVDGLMRLANDKFLDMLQEG